VVTVHGGASCDEAAIERDAAASPVDERGRVSRTAQIDVWPIRH
jgi:hypothetical protein